MTPEQRAATERLRRIRKGESPEDVYGHKFIAVAGGGRVWTTKSLEQRHDDEQSLIALCLAEHPADDDDPLDAEFLRRVGGNQDDHPHKWTFHRVDAMPIGLWIVDDGWKVMLIHGQHAASCIRRGLKTRGQFRRLASALNIELKETEGKR